MDMYVRVTGALHGIGPGLSVTWRPGPGGGRWSVWPDPKDVGPYSSMDVGGYWDWWYGWYGWNFGWGWGAGGNTACWGEWVG